VSSTAAELLGRTAGPVSFDWADRDYLLYALAVGVGGTSEQLSFVYERNLKVVPTFPTVLAWIAEPTFESLGAHPDHALHMGQQIELHRMPTGPMRVAVTGRVISVQDKGRERGAVIVMRQDVVCAADSGPVATLTTTCFARDLGGCGSAGEPLAGVQPSPSRPADHRVLYEVREDAALLYRLTGDRNPLHADPAAAAAAGFGRPILHGLCSFGMTCRAVLDRIAAWQPERILSHSARFSAPVYPGEMLEISLWQNGLEVSFEARVPARELAVLTGGKSVLRQGESINCLRTVG
jgi:acyl dehydratase